jgi:hypothetical protein
MSSVWPICFFSVSGLRALPTQDAVTINCRRVKGVREGMIQRKSLATPLFALHFLTYSEDRAILLTRFLLGYIVRWQTRLQPTGHRSPACL